MPRIRLLSAALAACFVLPAAASAGEPFTIGEGSDPHMVVTADGTAQIVWTDDTADKVHYCAIARGSNSCFLKRELDASFGGLGPGRAYVVRDGSKVHIAMSHHAMDDSYLWTSLNGGSSWSAAKKIYNAGEGTQTNEPMLDSTGLRMVFPASNPGRHVWAADLDESDSAMTARAALPDGGIGSLLYDMHVASTGGQTLVAVANDLGKSVFWRYEAGNVNAAANWSAAPTVIGDGDTARLAAGMNGPYLMTTAGQPGNRRVEVRRWDNAVGVKSFAAPVTVANEDGYINDVTVSPSGGVGTIWRRNGSPNRLRFGLSTDNGQAWSVNTIALEDAVMSSMDVGLGTDNKGWAVFEGKNAPTSNARKLIRLASTDTVQEPQPPGTTTTPPTTTAPPFVPPKTAPQPPAKPSPPRALVRRVSASVSGATLEVGLPNGCIPAGKPFVATLSWKKQRRKGNLFVKVARTDFFVGTKRLKIDRSAPFRQTLRIPKPKAGQSYRFRARAFVKVRRGKAPKKSIFATLKVC